MIPKQITTCLGVYSINCQIYRIHDSGNWYIETHDDAISDKINDVYELGLRRSSGPTYETFPWCTEEKMLEVVNKIKIANEGLKKYKFKNVGHSCAYLNGNLFIGGYEVSRENIESFIKLIRDHDNNDFSSIMLGPFKCQTTTDEIQIGCTRFDKKYYTKRFIKILYTHYPELKN